MPCFPPCRRATAPEAAKTPVTALQNFIFLMLSITSRQSHCGAHKLGCYPETEKELLACREATRFGNAPGSNRGVGAWARSTFAGQPRAAVLLRWEEIGTGSPPPRAKNRD